MDSAYQQPECLCALKHFLSISITQVRAETGHSKTLGAFAVYRDRAADDLSPVSF